jgi:hypothetical protein
MSIYIYTYFKTNSVHNLSEHKHEKHQHKCVHCEFETHYKDTFDAHRKDNHKYSCDKCLLTSKDDWKHQIHICKVDITNPTFGDFYTKEWLDHNGCNAIYSLEANEDIICLHSDKCWSKEIPCHWTPYFLQDEPIKPGDVRHIQFTRFVNNGEDIWSSILEEMNVGS